METTWLPAKLKFKTYLSITEEIIINNGKILSDKLKISYKILEFIILLLVTDGWCLFRAYNVICITSIDNDYDNRFIVQSI